MTDIERWLHKWLVVKPAALLDEITRRRFLHIVAIVLILICIQQIMLPDLIFLFGIDLGLVMEVTAALLVLSARGGARIAYTVVRTMFDRARARLGHAWRRGAIRAVRARIVRVLKPPKSSDDEDAGQWAFA